jgi:hypothetical protein
MDFDGYPFDEISEYWHLACELSIVEAALLIIGVEPQGNQFDIERKERKPDGYEAVRNSLIGGVCSGAIKGEVAQYEDDEVDNENRPERTIPAMNTCDPYSTYINVESLKDYLREKGFTRGFFFRRESSKLKYLDQSHPRYSPKLAAVIEAWENYDEESNETGTPKQRIMKWLRLNAARFGLTNDDGNPSENVIEELAKVANWAPGGGAPKVNAKNLD